MQPNGAPEFAAPPIDPGNPYALAALYPAAMTTMPANTPAGQRLLVTFRCGPATLSIPLERADAKRWAAILDREADAMSGLIVPHPVIPPGGGT